jgi:ABC-type transport system substrate-binding protein
MKFLLLSFGSFASAAAFSAVAPKKSDATPSSIVDRSMKNVDASSATTFDPTTGAAPAVLRNNNNEVWVSQVRCRTHWYKRSGF